MGVMHAPQSKFTQFYSVSLKTWIFHPVLPPSAAAGFCFDNNVVAAGIICQVALVDT